MGCFFVSKNEKKLERFHLLAQHEHVFACPLCSKPMKVIPYTSFVCSSGHCFDFAKHGYVNLLTRPPKTKYDTSLFAARQHMNASGFFEPLISRISQGIDQNMPPHLEPLRLLDAGCGEGSHLVSLQQKILERTKIAPLGVGLDISKEGIKIAAKRSSNTIWCVADLARCPVMDRSFSVILNLLSPSNYAEFHRILADDGIVIKVIPESHYLQELREALHQHTLRDTYSNKRIQELFKRHFSLIGMERVTYSILLQKEELHSLGRMTPLSWGTSDALLQRWTNQEQAEVTVDFSILYGKKG